MPVASILSGTLKLYFTYRLLRTLTLPWDQTPAFKAGVLDADGKLLVARRDQTPEQRLTYSPFDRMAYNLKRLLNQVPGGKTRLASYAAALALIKEKDENLARSIHRMIEDAPVSVSGNVTTEPGETSRKVKKRKTPMARRITQKGG